MADYRDDRRALQYERDRLAEDLSDAEQQLSAQQHQLAAQQQQLASQQAKLQALESQLAQPQPTSDPDAPWRCSGCGQQNEAHYRFCLGCGATRQERTMVAQHASERQRAGPTPLAGPQPAQLATRRAARPRKVLIAAMVAGMLTAFAAVLVGLLLFL